MKSRSKTKIIKRTMAAIVAVLVVLAFMPAAVADKAYAESIPEPNVTYTADNNWVGTLVIDENMTVLISGVDHQNTYREGAAIKICGNTTANLVFEGKNVLKGDPTVLNGCAGIEVEEGSTVNIYGKDGSTLEVTGGNYGAGIGGCGFQKVGRSNPKAGNINIYSGNITAIGGDKGAGIGAGYHQSAADINIKGGNITALGTGSGAGIGSGYGTSGGATSLASGIGFYHGGDITISDGTIRAAAWHINFDKFDPYDPSTLRGEGYADTFAAGIGGGYGASSGNVIIEGDADVIALGSCGGTGIGTGRGTSKSINYDEENAFCNVNIRGNANVIAMTTYDARPSVVGDCGGAGIGLAHGWGLEDETPGTVEPLGTVKIEGKANVFAYAESGANGIGAGHVVGKTVSSADGVIYPTNAHLKELSIGPDCTVVAICDKPGPEHTGIDDAFPAADIPVAALAFNEQFFENAGIGSATPFFTEDRFPAVIEVRSADSQEKLTAYPLSHSGVIQVAVHVPSAYSSVYYKVKDVKESGKGVLLARSDSGNGWKFADGYNDVTHLQYESYKITYNLNGGRNASGNPDEYMVYGPAVKLKAPSRSGYTFKGWYGNKSLSGSKITSIPAGSSGDKEVWAKWSKNTKKTKKTKKKSKKNEDGDTVLIAKATAKGRDSMVISWNKVKGADGYDVFFAYCGSKDKKVVPEKAATIKGNKTLRWTKTGLKKNMSYQSVVRAYKVKNGKKTYIRSSPVTHAYTSGGTKRYTNAKAVVAKKTRVSLKKGKTYKMKADVSRLKKSKKLMPATHGPKMRFISSNKKVATVSKKGVIRAKGKGSCKICIVAHNGASRTIKVRVK